ncbi:hypothetical protein OIU76_028682 [Salix suchowensis]|uniref:Uncharacterized protein n=1 Tax=Salix suchowensis TaxID=1278906 RepID=A0ABQ9B674_9ROSI|nr:hypothetical protein OIU76_028682 [Salix suchowensis]KAJ6371847.1 hypothetical protein OIU77_002211 [Salix suchowensis]
MTGTTDGNCFLDGDGDSDEETFESFVEHEATTPEIPPVSHHHCSSASRNSLGDTSDTTQSSITVCLQLYGFMDV